MRPVRVYVAFVPFHAHLVRSILENVGVPAEVRNENLAPYGGIGAEVWVAAEDAEVAAQTIAEIEAKPQGALSFAEPSGGELALAEDGEREGT